MLNKYPHFWLFLKRTIVITIVVLMVPIITFLYFLMGKPTEGTKEYLVEHGWIKGQPFDVDLGNVTLRIPTGLNFSVYTKGRIVKGQADRVTFTLLYHKFFDHPEIELPNASLGWMSDGLMRIKVRGGGYEDPIKKDKQIEQWRWRKITELPMLGLIEYERQQFNGGWGHVTYVGLNDADRTPAGSLIRYSCKGYPPGEISDCMSSYTIPGLAHVNFTFRAPLLPFWKVVNRDVVDFVSTLIIK